MSAARSAGIVLYRRASGGLEVLLVHPGGPLWARRDAGAWSLPKGEYSPGEDPLVAARREFQEELGVALPHEGYRDLGEIKQKAGKRVRAWGVEGDIDAGAITSNVFELEWPPRSGRRQQFPEVDRAQWFTLSDAQVKLNAAQVQFVERLAAQVG